VRERVRLREALAVRGGRSRHRRRP
jgi:hypothetical protein